MQQRIIGFHQDDEQHWVADLACGHTQHVRHDPPWQERPWVCDAEARSARIGRTLNCPVCDEGAAAPAPTADDAMRSPISDDEQIPAHLSPAAAEAYLDARIQGLCHAGALEIAERIDSAQGR